MYNDPNDSQNNFYGKNTMAGQPVQSSPYPGQFNAPVSQAPKKGVWNWYKRQKKATIWGVGCGILVLLMLCSCANTDNTSTTNAAPNSVVTTTATHEVVKPTPTAQPTATPTPTPKPTPTPIPTPRPTPTSIPTPKPVPTKAPAPQPTQPPAPQPTQPPVVTGVNGNPWGYDFNYGNLVYNPPADFCSGVYFTCVGDFWSKTRGYVEQCKDLSFSHSGGIRGSCSYHGGNLRPLYSH